MDSPTPSSSSSASTASTASSAAAAASPTPAPVSPASSGATDSSASRGDAAPPMESESDSQRVTSTSVAPTTEDGAPAAAPLTSTDQLTGATRATQATQVPGAPPLADAPLDPESSVNQLANSLASFTFALPFSFSAAKPASTAPVSTEDSASASTLTSRAATSSSSLFRFTGKKPISATSDTTATNTGAPATSSASTSASTSTTTSTSALATTADKAAEFKFKNMAEWFEHLRISRLKQARLVDDFESYYNDNSVEAVVFPLMLHKYTFLDRPTALVNQLHNYNKWVRCHNGAIRERVMTILRTADTSRGFLSFGERLSQDPFIDSVVFRSGVIPKSILPQAFNSSYTLLRTLPAAATADRGAAAAPRSSAVTGRAAAAMPSSLPPFSESQEVIAARNAALASVTGFAQVLENRNSPLPSFNIETHSRERLLEIAARLFADDNEMVLEATSQFRRILSIERSPPIDAVIRCGVIPVFVAFLGTGFPASLQYEAGWALTNIASGNHEQTLQVLDANALPRFIALLESSDARVADQAVWAIGNIAGDTPAFRDMALEAGTAEIILRIFGATESLQSLDRMFLSNSIWMISNLCRGKPRPPFALVAPLIPLLHRVALTFTSYHEVLVDTIWALSYLSDGSNDQINAVIRNYGFGDILVFFVQCLGRGMESMLSPALRTIANIVTGDDLQTQIVLNHGILSCVPALIRHRKTGIRKETCWMLSNITAGNTIQIQAVISANILPDVINVLQTDQVTVAQEAAYVISNLFSGATPSQAIAVCTQECVAAMARGLGSGDAKTITVILEGLLAAAPHVSRLPEMLEAANAVETIESLQNHQNSEVYSMSVRILEELFSAEIDDDLSPVQRIGHATAPARMPTSPSLQSSGAVVEIGGDSDSDGDDGDDGDEGADDDSGDEETARYGGRRYNPNDSYEF